MFTLRNRSYLDLRDIAHLRGLIASGRIERYRAMYYLQSWADQYAHDAYVEGNAARDFEDAAYGRN